MFNGDKPLANHKIKNRIKISKLCGDTPHKKRDEFFNFEIERCEGQPLTTC